MALGECTTCLSTELYSWLQQCWLVGHKSIMVCCICCTSGCYSLLCLVCLAIDISLFTAVVSWQLSEDSLYGSLCHSHTDYWSHAICLSFLSISEAQAGNCFGWTHQIECCDLFYFSPPLANILLPLPVCMKRFGGYKLQIHKPRNVLKVSLFPIWLLWELTEPLSYQNSKSFVNFPFWFPTPTDTRPNNCKISLEEVGKVLAIHAVATSVVVVVLLLLAHLSS